MKYFLLIIMIVSTEALAEPLCKKIDSKGEGHWPIDENQFTKEATLEALNALKSIVNVEDIESDMYANHFIIIKGYFLKKQVEVNKKYNEKLYNSLKNDFCAFIENEAYVRH